MRRAGCLTAVVMLLALAGCGDDGSSLPLLGAPGTSAVEAIYALQGGNYYVFWSGNDETSGIAAYNVDYQAEGDANWTPWLGDTSQTGALFTPPDGRIYWFRSQARDAAGNLEAAHPTGDMSTGHAIQLLRVIMLPRISH